MIDLRKPVFDAIKAARGGQAFTAMEVPQIDTLLDRLGIARAGAVAPPPVPGAVRSPPSWVIEARKEIGVKEIVGPKHSPDVLAYSKELGRPYSDDETPWCGLFVGAMLKRAGYPVVDIPERAASWASYGSKCEAMLGAIGVKARPGGNHVFFIVGVTPDGKRYKMLGGNQGNAVTISDVLVSEVNHVRWPPQAAGQPTRLPNMPLPIMPAGVISRNEA